MRSPPLRCLTDHSLDAIYRNSNGPLRRGGLAEESDLLPSSIDRGLAREPPTIAFESVIERAVSASLCYHLVPQPVSPVAQGLRDEDWPAVFPAHIGRIVHP